MAGENYRRVVPTFWTDPDVKRKLTRDQKLLLLYFCTSPHSNMIGVYYCPLAYAANETDLPMDDIRRAVAGALAAFLTYDEETEEVFVHALAKHNVGDELTADGKNGKPDHRIAGVAKLLEAVHSPRLRRAFLQRYAGPYRLTMPLPDQREAPSEPLASPSPSPSEAIAVHSSNKTRHSSAPTAARERDTWLTPFWNAWIESRGGEPPGGRFAKAFGHLRKAHGTRQTLAVWVGYLEDRKDQGFCTVEDFSQNYGVYRRRWGVEIGEDGTERPMPDSRLGWRREARTGARGMAR